MDDSEVSQQSAAVTVKVVEQHENLTAEQDVPPAQPEVIPDQLPFAGYPQIDN